MAAKKRTKLPPQPPTVDSGLSERWMPVVEREHVDLEVAPPVLKEVPDETPVSIDYDAKFQQRAASRSTNSLFHNSKLMRIPIGRDKDSPAMWRRTRAVRDSGTK